MKSNRAHQPVLIQVSHRETRAVTAPPKRQRGTSIQPQKEEKKKLRRSFSSLKKSLAPCHRHRIKALVNKEKQQSRAKREISLQLGVKTRKPASKTPKRKAVTFRQMFQANSTFKTPQRLPQGEKSKPVQIEEVKEDDLKIPETPEVMKRSEDSAPRFSPFILRTGRLRPETVQIVDKKKTLSFKPERSQSLKQQKSRKKEQLLNLLAIDRVHTNTLDDMIKKDTPETAIEQTLGDKEKNLCLFKKLLKQRERSSTPKFRTQISSKQRM